MNVSKLTSSAQIQDSNTTASITLRHSDKRYNDLSEKQDGINELVASILLAAAEDYVGLTPKICMTDLGTRLFQKPEILNDLRSEWLVSISDGLSALLADALEEDPDRIKEQIKKDKLIRKQKARTQIKRTRPTKMQRKKM